MSTFNKIAKYTSQQNGVISRTDLVSLGVSKKSIETMVKKGILLRAGHGIYTAFGSKDSWLRRATILTMRYKLCLLSHESVLHLYKIFDYKFDRQKRLRNRTCTRNLIHTINKSKLKRDNEQFTHRTTKFLDTDLGNYHNGIAHVSLERAIIDCSHQLNDHELSYAIEKSLRMKLTTIDRIRHAIDFLGVAPGRDISRILKILNHMHTDVAKVELGSFFEKTVENVIEPISKYKLLRQYEIYSSKIKMRVDFAILELKIVIEADSYDFHGGRLAFDKDKLRYAYLQSQGWLVLSITTNMTAKSIRKLFLDMQDLRSVDAANAPIASI